MFCMNCGNQVRDGAAFCEKCGTSLQQAPTNPTPSQPYQAYQNPYQNQPPYTYTQPAPKKSNAALILGILGIIFAWLFALVGHILSIIGIVKGVQENSQTGNSTGLIVSIIGEVCAVLSSLIGIVTMLGI